jgi:predicted ABC-type transport system involved in lysophospholipase L1 biosynthesis ATPase subunit
LIVVTHARDLANRMARLLELKSGNLVESARTPDPTFK